eukprot:snap_masked-scaffold591_size129331-processed-gene-0.4 protein:Tk08230 transcript:snap_masked-scaffold591_size129331-processed-gene-0.4-mRNA-1 annotation:"SCO-spondin"
MANEIMQALEECNKFRPSQQRETLGPHPRPGRPFEAVSTDLFEYSCHTFMFQAEGLEVLNRFQHLEAVESLNMLLAIGFGLLLVTAYFILKRHIQGPIFQSRKRLDGQTIAITGANTGIGLETGKDFYRRGGHVICLCRNVDKGKAAIQSIKNQVKNDKNTGSIHLMPMDLSSMDSIRQAGETLLKEQTRLDILVLNAGVMMSPMHPRTKDGFEMQMGTNHLGHYLFTRMLIPLLKKTAQDHGEARVVTLASMANEFANAPIRLHDLNWEKEEDFSPGQAYFHSKMANIMFSRELGKRLADTGVTTYSLHPGVIATELNRHASESSNILAYLFNFLCYNMASGLIKTPRHGAQTTLYCSLAEGLKGQTGKYYMDCQERIPGKQAREDLYDRDFWELNEFSNWQGTGQNVARDIAKGKAGQFDAHKLIGHWFNQILYFDSEGVKSFGCGWVQFNYRGFEDYYENFLVCNYGPSANIWEQPVYDIAEETCNCPCIGCDKETGLCPANCNYAVWSTWEEWAQCSQSCGGGVRNRERDCQESNFPPRETSSVARLIEAHGSLDLVPLFGNDSALNEVNTRQSALFGNLDPELCLRGDQEENGECNPGGCPELSEWSEWSDCTKTCESGERSRERTCDDQRNENNPCNARLTEMETCNTQLCPLFNEWSEWSPCSATCGGGGQERERNCYDPNFRLKCDGEPRQSRFVVRACNVDPCPSWTQWSAWSQCSASCGGGQNARSRECTLPDGAVRPNAECGEGESNETGNCNENVLCPVLGEWTEWSQCSVSCGGGDRSRTRTCGVPGSTQIASASTPASENPCQQPLFESEKCNDDRCPVYTPWSEWSQCSATCGGGSQRRNRQCVPANSRLFCEGVSEEDRTCNESPCPNWTEWGEWSECSFTCGGGTRQNTRQCELPNGEQVKGSQCGVGPATEEESCNTDQCPELGPWTEWGPCTVTCGGGEKTRMRECGLPKLLRDDNPCQLPLLEKMECHPEECPTLTEWADWSQCSHTCGGGFRQKTRECVGPNANDVSSSSNGDENACMEPLEVIEACNEDTCPVWSVWGEWTICSKTCGGGERTRYRQCTDPVTGQEAFCPGSNEESEDCNTQDCPYFTEWTEWTDCSLTCGSGTRSKVRECIVPRDGDANICNGETRTQESCNETPCPVWSEWTDWGQCTATCGGGTEKRIRDCLLAAARNGNGTNFYGCDGDTWEMRGCNEHNCPTWTEWTEFTDCSKTCGGGRRVKTRECNLPPNIPAPALALFCPGDEKVIEDCNTGTCPKPTEWTEWGECSVSCGGGTRQKTRECVNFRDQDGNPCNENLVDEEPCNEQPCPAWTEWTEWTSCTKTCDKGRRKRARDCVLFTRSDCPGEDEELEDCNPEPCPALTPWGEWTQCTLTCGGGTQRRVRDCLSPISGFDSNGCMEPLEEIMVCSADACPAFTEWSEWTECSADCGGGTKTHVRECTQNGEEAAQDTCLGDALEQVPCNDDVECPRWTEWNTWGDCSVTCGEGTRQRGRECTRPVETNGKLLCNGEDLEVGPCDPSVPQCPMWSDWSEWSDCSDECGGGSRTHVRVCSAGNEVDANGKSPCGFGDFEESEACNADIKCPELALWSEWSEWNACSQSCGGGMKERARQCGSSDGTTGCPGPSRGIMFCNIDPCPTDADWAEWGEWSQCSVPCGGGDRSRRRDCSSSVSTGYGPQTSPECPGDELEHSKCNVQACSTWSEWTMWSTCSKTCGKGAQRRSRDCQHTNLPRGNYPRLGLLASPCPGEPQQARSCILQECPLGRRIRRLIVEIAASTFSIGKNPPHFGPVP